jgi:flagellar hook-associated protein 1 FlgK
MIQISAGGVDLTGRLRQGELGALLGLRDDDLTARMADFDALAADLITRTNALTAGATDLYGNAGGPLFEPDPAPGSGAASSIRVASNVLSDPRLLAISASGAPGDGSIALQISELRETASAALGNKSPASFMADILTGVGSRIVQSDVAASVAEELVENLHARRDSISGVSLDEEAVELMRHQRAYEAAARFMQVLNEVTEITISVGRA